MNKVKIIVGTVLVLVIVVTLAVLTANDGSKIEQIYRDTIATLDKGESVESLFAAAPETVKSTVDVDSQALGEFYQGSTSEIKNFEMYHETGNIYRAYGEVVTDQGDYFVCIAATGARLIDKPEIKQLIIEDYKNFNSKHVFKKKIFNKYIKKASEYGVTIRLRGDKR